MKTGFSHLRVDEVCPAVAIRDARLVVAIANEAEDEAIRKALEIIESEMVEANTCRNPKATLSKEHVRRNGVLNGICHKIRALMHEEIPF